MAGTAANFTIYNDEFYGGFVETIQQNVDAFNAASANALILETDLHEGNYQKEAFFDVISSLVARRDNTSVSSVSDLTMSSDEFVGVKLNRRIGPVAQTADAWRKISKDPAEMSFIIGQQSARAVQQEMLNRALAALEAKLDSVAALEHSATSATITTEGLVDGMSKFGDASNQIVAWVMHGKVFHDLLKDQITDAIYRADGVQIMQGIPATLGRPVIITDSSSLVEADGVSSGVDAYSTLGLTRGAAVCKNSEPPLTVMDLVTGTQNITYRFQGEYAYTLSLRGCEWDVANGGTNPADAAVATATNWDTQVADNKLLPGIIVKSR